MIVNLKSVSKVSNGYPVLQQINLKISKGEAIAIIGHNGSGKSSLLKLIAGIYEPSNGYVERRQVKIGYVPEHFPEGVRFTIEEYLLLTGKMSKHQPSELRKKISDYADIFSISSYLQTPLRRCSKGTKQKVGIIQSLLQEPSLLLLDEPITGLDQASQQELMNLLRTINGDKTIVFSAHESVLVDELADRMIEIEKGRMIADCTVEKREGKRVIKALIANKQSLIALEGAESVVWEDDKTAIFSVKASQSDQLLQALLQRHCSILEVTERR